MLLGSLALCVQHPVRMFLATGWLGVRLSDSLDAPDQQIRLLSPLKEFPCALLHAYITPS